MKKGDVLWIIYNDCLYCSEVDKCAKFPFDNGYYLNPIIGNIICVFVDIRADINKVVSNVLGYTSNNTALNMSISLNFDLLADQLNLKQ